MKIENEGEEIMLRKESKKENSNKLVTIVSILIVITLLIVVGIVILMAATYKEKLTITIDGQKVELAEDIIMFADGTTDMYVSIKDIAPYVGYEAHNRRI